MFLVFRTFISTLFFTDIYQPVVGQSALVDKQFLRLQEAIGREIDYQEELLEVLGMMDALFATLTEKRATYLEENKSYKDSGPGYKYLNDI